MYPVYFRKSVKLLSTLYFFAKSKILQIYKIYKFAITGVYLLHILTFYTCKVSCIDCKNIKMSVSAKQLSKSGARGKQLDTLIRDQLQIIDDRLLQADRTWGRNVVAVDLPTAIPLAGLDKKDAQRIIYSTIIRSLERRGFETRLLLEPEHTKIFISWMTDLDSTEIEAMNIVIREKRIDTKDLAIYLECGNSTSIMYRPSDTRPADTSLADMRPNGGKKK